MRQLGLFALLASCGGIVLDEGLGVTDTSDAAAAPPSAQGAAGAGSSVAPLPPPKGTVPPPVDPFGGCREGDFRPALGAGAAEVPVEVADARSSDWSPDAEFPACILVGVGQRLIVRTARGKTFADFPIAQIPGATTTPTPIPLVDKSARQMLALRTGRGGDIRIRMSEQSVDARGAARGRRGGPGGPGGPPGPDGN